MPNMTWSLTNWGRRVMARRESLGLSAKQVHQTLGSVITLESYYDIESMDDDADMQTIWGICAALRSLPRDFFEEQSEPAPDSDDVDYLGEEELHARFWANARADGHSFTDLETRVGYDLHAFRSSHSAIQYLPLDGFVAVCEIAKVPPSKVLPELLRVRRHGPD
jgi:transcriptional regulator with XRE-family HTH domain